MDSHNALAAHHEHSGHGHSSHERPHGVRPFDSSYHLVVRTVLWVIAGLVFLAFALWWFLT